MELKDFFTQNPRVAVAFSGGVDSAFLLYAAKQYAREVRAYYVRSLFQPQFEYEDAVRFSKEIDVPLSVIEVNALSDPKVVENPPNRCYFCKKVIFSSIIKRASEDGFSVLLDGTNASDSASDRPGMKALEELKVLSPLRECGLTKKEIRERSKLVGLFTWDKPSYACLATRIPTNCTISRERLEKTERAENFLMDLGFSDFRVRMICSNEKDSAKIQIRKSQFPLLIQNREKILEKLKADYSSVLLDLEARDEH
ncbi:MAG: ATP-dependent sacrificial sulfur transferase LarE [Treponema sp.]|nr:ATP-dependent sacrificial sulfur transferase LarE [Treponema sp.]